MQRLNLFGLTIIAAGLGFGACKTSRPTAELADAGAPALAPTPSKIAGTPVKATSDMTTRYNNDLDPALPNLPGWKPSTFLEDCKQISLNNSLILAMEDARPFATGDHLALDFADGGKQDLWSFETTQKSGSIEVGPYREQGVYLTRVAKNKRAKTLGYRYLLADPENGSCYLRSERYKSSEADILRIDAASLTTDALPRPKNRDEIFWKDRCRVEALNRTLSSFFAAAAEAKKTNAIPHVDAASTYFDQEPETKVRRYRIIIKDLRDSTLKVDAKYEGTRTDTTCDLKTASF